MKKFFIVLISVMFLATFAVPAMATFCGPEPCDPEAGQTAVLESTDPKTEITTPGMFGEIHVFKSSNFTSWNFFGNGGGDDFASATADGYAGFEATGYANALGSSTEYVGGHWGWIFNPDNWDNVPNPADVDGEAYAKGKAKTWAFALDLGNTSTAFAGAYAGGKANVFVDAFGVDGCPEIANATLWLGGNVYQSNSSFEERSNGQFVSAGNWSEASGMASKELSDVGQSYNILGIQFGGANVEGSIKEYHFAEVQGSSLVTINPAKSLFGYSQSSASLNPGSLTLNPGSYVAGGGGTGGQLNNGNGSYVGGVATFSYNGVTQGSGNASVTATMTSDSIFVSGSAHAQGN